MKLSELKLNPRNPRTISKEQFEGLKRDILNNPDGLDANKIVYKDGVVIAGNQRYRAIKELNLELKENWFKDVTGWTDDQIRDWIVQSNVHRGQFDYDELANEYEIEELEAYGVELPQYMNDDSQLVNRGDENSEWVGMPEFGIQKDSLKLVIQFEKEIDRDELMKKIDIRILQKGKRTWSTWYPFKERSDLSDVKYDN